MTTTVNNSTRIPTFIGLSESDKFMQTIWKYEVPVIDRFDLPLPAGATCLSVQIQRGVPCLWAQVNPDAHTVIRRFAVFGTGHNLPDVLGKFVGTFQLQGGALVFHLYEMPLA